MTTPKTTWGIGDYPQMAERLEPVAKRAAELVNLAPGLRVLDVGCGTGTFARLAAAQGCQVVGLDGEPALLDIARSLDRHGSQWRESDFAALDAADAAFDVVASLFGTMYALDHHAAARELARVCAPDGRVVLSAWTPGSFMPTFGRTVGQYLPPPPTASGPPTRWGEPHELATLLADAGLAIDTATTDHLWLGFDDTDQAASFLIRTAGHVLAERDRLIAAGQWDALVDATRTLVKRHVSSGRRPTLGFEYLLVGARRSVSASH